MSGDQSLTNFTEVPELVPKDVIRLRMLLSIVYDKETVPIVKVSYRTFLGKFVTCSYLENFELSISQKRQAVADGHL